MPDNYTPFFSFSTEKHLKTLEDQIKRYHQHSSNLISGQSIALCLIYITSISYTKTGFLYTLKVISMCENESDYMHKIRTARGPSDKV